MLKKKEISKAFLIQKYGKRAEGIISHNEHNFTLENIYHLLRNHWMLKNMRFSCYYNPDNSSISFYADMFKEYFPPEDEYEEDGSDYCGDPALSVKAYIEDSHFCIAVGMLDMDDMSQKYVVYVDNAEEQQRVFKEMVNYYIDLKDTLVSGYFYELSDLILPKLRDLIGDKKIQDRGFE